MTSQFAFVLMGSPDVQYYFTPIDIFPDMKDDFAILNMKDESKVHCKNTALLQIKKNPVNNLDFLKLKKKLSSMKDTKTSFSFPPGLSSPSSVLESSGQMLKWALP